MYMPKKSAHPQATGWLFGRSRKKSTSIRIHNHKRAKKPIAKAARSSTGKLSLGRLSVHDTYAANPKNIMIVGVAKYANAFSKYQERRCWAASWTGALK